jgi:hypothetical protein
MAARKAIGFSTICLLVFLVPLSSSSAAPLSQPSDLCMVMPTGGSARLPSTRFWQGANGYQSGCSDKFVESEISVDLSLFETQELAAAALASLGNDVDPNIKTIDLGDSGYEYIDSAVSAYVLFWRRNCYVGYIVTENLDLAGQAIGLARQADEAFKGLGLCSACKPQPVDPNILNKIQLVSIKAEENFFGCDRHP